MLVNKGKKDPNIKILIIRFSSIGDIVLTTPVIRCLALQLNAEVHFLTKDSFKSLLSGNPYLNKIWSLSENMIDLIRELKDEKFDFVVDLHKNLRSIRLCFSMGVKRLTYDKTTFEKFLMVNFKINILPKIHVVDRYLKSVEVLGVKNDGKGLNFFINQDLDVSLLIPNIPFVTAVIGATHYTKRLPVKKWIEYINSSLEYFVLLGGMDDIKAANQIIESSGTNVINLVGLTTLQESAKVISASTRIVTNDTGMMHIAAALQKPIGSMWGGTIKEYGFWPYFPDGIDLNINLEVTQLKCRPCSKFGRNDCPLGHFKCMKDISFEKIKEGKLN